MPVDEQTARSLAEKLQAFASTLPADEQEALMAMLRAYRASIEAALAGRTVLGHDDEGLQAAREALLSSAEVEGFPTIVITTITVLQTSRFLCKPKD